VGGALAKHPDVDEVDQEICRKYTNPQQLLMTGSAATYDRIVWGSTPEEIQK
jgi:hypothetical protein